MTNLVENRLTLDPDTVQFPATHYIFVEKRGDIPRNAPQAWNEFNANLAAVTARNTLTGYISLYRMEDGIYRAGVSVAAPPLHLPDGFHYEPFAGGKYRKFVLRGAHSHLGAATSQAIQTARELRFPLRDGFNIEHYVNHPSTTPEDQLVTEILFPVE